MSCSVFDVNDGTESGAELSYTTLQPVNGSVDGIIEGLMSLEDFCANTEGVNNIYNMLENGDDFIYDLMTQPPANATEKPVGEQQDFRSSAHGISNVIIASFYLL